MKVSQIVLVFLGTMSVEAIRMNIAKDEEKVPEEIVKDAASKGIVNADSATVANVAADVGRLE